MSKWNRIAPLTEEVHSGCLNCPSKPVLIEMERMLAVGFGSVSVIKDDECVWSGDDPEKTVQFAEDMAAQDEDHDWRITFFAPLWEGEWQRHGKENWVLIRKGEGFA